MRANLRFEAIRRITWRLICLMREVDEARRTVDQNGHTGLLAYLDELLGLHDLGALRLSHGAVPGKTE